MSTQKADDFKKPMRKAPPRILQSDWIFEGEPEVIIAHNHQEYRLRITRADKLILTK